MWGAYDVALCFLYNDNVSFIYLERDTNSDAQIYRLVFFPGLYGFSRMRTSTTSIWLIVDV